MFGQLSFFISHSWNDLRVNSQRTFFALLCISAGVAAIVSLQTLASMIQTTLVSNLRENNRGDLQINVSQSQNDGAVAQLEQGARDGLLLTSDVAFAGFQGNQYVLAEPGILAVQDWFLQNYPSSEFTYRQQLVDPIAVFTGSGVGTALIAEGTGEEVSGVVPVMIDASTYPFYGEIFTLEGKSLKEVLNTPLDIVLGVSAAETLGISVGQTLTVNGLEGVFNVVGIVTNEAEIRNPTQDILAALNGFYILDRKSLFLFEGVPVRSNIAYVKLNEDENVDDVETALREAFPFLRATTTEELRQAYTQISEGVNQLVTVMGLIALLLGSIGIINTMQVIVRRRVQEIAVLKTVGLQANQITQLFLVEALMMGVIGSIAGVLLGWVLVFAIKGVAEGLLGSSLPFLIVPSAVVSGIFVGTIVTTVFGFIPTLSAGQIRPSLVLRPSDNPIPKAGRVRTAFALLLTILALVAVAYGILGNVFLAFGVIVGSFTVAGILLFFLNFLIWIVGRFFPSFGIIDLKLSLREMLATRGRGSVTLLALVVGVFSLSLITMLASTVSETLSDAFLTGDNIFIQVGGGEDALQTVIERIEALEGENDYAVTRTYNMTLVSLNKATEEVLNTEQISEVLRANDFFYQQSLSGTPSPEDTNTNNGSDFSGNQNLVDRRLREMQSVYSPIDSLPLDEARTQTLKACRHLTPEDNGQPYVVVQTSPFLDELGIQVGDSFTYEYSYGGFLGLGGTTGTITYEIVGITDTITTVNLAESGQYTFVGSLPEAMPPSQIRMTANIQDNQISPLRRSLSTLPQTFLLETESINRLLTAFIGQFTTFPLLVALLGLVVGGIVIANSVALSTMERRREIAIMKSVGLQRERVLGMLLIENGILGIIGGLLGVGMGLIGLVVLLGDDIGNRPLPIDTAFLLMGLCLLVALVAALTTAWGASGEKPLNVLRYE